MQTARRLVTQSLQQLCAISSKEADTLQKKDVCALSDCYRFLRNACATHDSDVRAQVLAHDADVVDLTVQLLASERVAAVEGSAAASDDDVLLLRRCALQFLANFTTSCDIAQQTVWPRIAPRIVRLLSAADAKTATFSAMLLYNCACNDNIAQEMFKESFDVVGLVKALLKLIDVDSIEWALFTIERFLRLPGFLNYVFPHLDAIADRLILLHIIEPILAGECEATAAEKSAASFVDTSSVVFLVEQFLLATSSILSRTLDPKRVLADSASPEISFDPRVVLQCLSSPTSPHTFSLQANEKLFDCCVEILKRLEALRYSPDSHFCVSKNFDIYNTLTDNEVVRENPFLGFKRDLVKLIANMCHKNAANKQRIREKDGIVHLLNCTQPDANNPFITQWAVFALRNICYDNLENQRFIAEMNPKGLAGNHELLSQLGLKAEIDASGKVKLVSITNSN